MSPQNRRTDHLIRRFPRVSGDEPGAFTASIDPSAFSPRERG